MRSPEVFGDHSQTSSLPSNHATNPSTSATQALLTLQSLQEHLSPWLGGPTKNLQSQSLLLMLTALKTASESYLETPLSTAEIVLPYPVSASFLTSLRSACSILSLHMPLSAQPPAGIFAARAHGIGGKCNTETPEPLESTRAEEDPAQLILAVNYSRAALTGLLLVEECGVFKHRRVLHETSLGTDELDNSSRTRIREDLERALRDLTNLPLEDGNGAGLRQISELVLVGESAGNGRLKETLRELLREQLSPHAALQSIIMDDEAVNSPRDRKSENRVTSTEMISPVFAASRGVAQDYWDRIKIPQQVDENGDRKDL